MEIKTRTKTPPRQDVPELETDPDVGLTGEQARQRLEAGWGNDTHVTAARTEKEIILQNTCTFFNLIFVVLAVLLVVSGSSIKNMTFLIVAICNTVIGCYQEIRAKRAVDKLNLVAEQTFTVIRDGEPIQLPTSALVRDDVVRFATGDQICADGMVLEGEMLVNEALVTGEAAPVSKEPGDDLLSGSFVVSGHCCARLTNVGADSFAARLAAEAKANPHAAKSEMMRSLDKLIRWVAVLLVIVGSILLHQELVVLKLSFRDGVEDTVAALVGMIPEGLYLLTSVAMAVSSMKLAKSRVLVQDMNCIEALARVDVLCVDKTGTVTQPYMQVENVVPLSEDTPEYLEQVLSSLFSGVEDGNDTTAAMTAMFGEAPHWEPTRRVPFTSQTKWSGGEFGEHGAFVTGAPEFVMGTRFSELEEQVQEWSAQGYRVLLTCAYDGTLTPHLAVDRLRPLALVLLTNPIRPEAPETFAYFREQGVAIKVISGDNPVTVSQIALRAGIENADKYIDARTLETKQDYDRAVCQYTVFGRVTPEQKKKLLEALKRAGHTVAMTGDGVNDVLAMKQADCSIAMASGAKAASQVAQLVLLDSDFSAMTSIVAEGRRVINNIQRSATLFLVKNIFSLGLAIISLFTNLPYPIVPLHLSVISGLTIGVPSFFLAMEPNYERVHGRFLPSVLRRAFPGGLTNIFVVLAAQLFMVTFDLPEKPISTVCAALLAIVGLLVLFRTCKPFDRFRRLIWGTMTVALVFCFTFGRSLFELETGNNQTLLVMVTLLIMTPTVFAAVQRVFDWGDYLVQKFSGIFPKRKKKRYADL